MNIDISHLSNVFDFEYFETYSLQRGSDYEKIRREKEEIFDQLSKKFKSDGLSVEENQKLSHLDSQLNNVQFLFDENQKIHFSAEKIKRFDSNENEAKELIKIFNIKTQHIPSWMCAPIYRDAIIFYDKNNSSIEVLNICFSCEFIQNFTENFVDADETVYLNLKNLLQDFGHKIGTEE